jgi:CTP:molybdopterin cytidylyltransferase MocA
MLQNFPLIMLAGGKSSRMGTPKGLLDYRGNLWLLEQLSRYRAAAGKRVVVVLGFHHEQYFEKIPWLWAAQKEPAHQLGLEILVVVNPHPEQGQFSSLLCALNYLPNISPGHEECSQRLQKRCSELRTPNSERVFLLPGSFILPIDVPGPGKEVYEKLAEALDAKTAAAIPRYQLKGGHPVLLSKSFCRHLISVDPASPEARLDFQIKILPGDRVAFVSVDNEEIGLNMNFRNEFQSYSLRG